ncbi:MAG: radical SAM protein [Deltaproteobacteria bacterium]|nr:radical SAM protein [Deltaproteobacteria bacterium]
MRPRTAVLVGPSLQGNLALEYLGASVEAAGHRVRLVSFDTKADAPRCVRSILEFSPDLIGLSIAFQCSVDDQLELARLLRMEGYRGHVTCGGHVPTFCFREILKAAPEIDTVVRHEGERTLVELLDALGRGEEPRGLRGLVWREGGEIAAGPARPLLSDLDSLPTPLRRQSPLVVGGAPIAVMLTSRGCIGECTYCCLRAFGKDAGGKRFRMRSAGAAADEIASAYHELGVRVIILQDDLFILPSERKSVERMNAISQAMKARGVGKVLFWIKGRPETITPSVAEAARELGAIHMFLGVENAAPDRLRYLGRTHSRKDNERAIALCLEHKIRSSYNIMLFDPDCTLEEIGANIDFASEHLDLTWNVCRTEIYPGTPLLARLEAEGRLEGDWRAYGYRMRDPRAEMMFRILRVCFAQRAFSNESLLNRLINLSFTRHVHEELLPGPATDVMSAKVDRLVRDVYRDTVDELRRVAQFAARGGFDDLDTCRDFAVDTAMAINERDNLWNARVDEIGFLLDARGAKIRAR